MDPAQESPIFPQGASPIVPDYGASITHVPIEVLDLIFDLLSIEDVVHVSMTCQRLRETCQHAAFWHHRWRQLDVPEVIALCRPLRPEYEVVRARKMQLELQGRYSGSPQRLRRIQHRLHPDDVILLPGGRFLLIKSLKNHGTILHYDLDDDAPVPRPFFQYDAPKLPGLMLASLCSSTKYEIAVVVISAERRDVRYYDGQIDFFRISLSDDKAALRVDSHSKLMINFGGSLTPTLQGTILLRECLEPKRPIYVIELIDLARSSENQLFGTRFIPAGERQPRDVWYWRIRSIRLLPPDNILIAYAVYVERFPVPPFDILPLFTEGSLEIVSIPPTFTLRTSSPIPVVYSSPSSLCAPKHDYFLVADGLRVHAIRNDFSGVSRSSEVPGHTRLGQHSVLHAASIKGTHSLHVLAFRLNRWTSRGKSVVFGNTILKSDLVTSGVVDIPLPNNEPPRGMIYDEWSGRVMFRTSDGKDGPHVRRGPGEKRGGYIYDLTGPITDVDFTLGANHSIVQPLSSK